MRYRPDSAFYAITMPADWPRCMPKRIYEQCGCQIFTDHAIEADPEYFEAVKPFFRKTFVESGREGSEGYDIEKVWGFHSVTLAERKGDVFLEKLMSHLSGGKTDMLTYYRITPAIRRAVRDYCGIELDYPEIADNIFYLLQYEPVEDDETEDDFDFEEEGETIDQY